MFTSKVTIGIVTIHNIVETKTQFAASSSSAWWISAIFKITDAHGTEEMINIAFLKSGVRKGRKYTAKKQAIGNIIIFKKQIK